VEQYFRATGKIISTTMYWLGLYRGGEGSGRSCAVLRAAGCPCAALGRPGHELYRNAVLAACLALMWQLVWQLVWQPGLVAGTRLLACAPFAQCASYMPHCALSRRVQLLPCRWEQRGQR
jgi:hypothetical protein